MTNKKLISTIKYVAGTKPVFLLSEVLTYLDEQISVHQLFSALSPCLNELHLFAKVEGDDYKITRITLSPSYRLNQKEVVRQGIFFDTCTLPDQLERAIEDYIEKKVGKPWDDPRILERLRRAIVAQKDDYWRDMQTRKLTYTKGYQVLGYLAYHFPVYFMQTEYLLHEIASLGLLKKTTTILDAGTGPGVVPLAIADYYSRMDDAAVTIASIERSDEHIEAFRFLADAFVAKNSKISISPPILADIRSVEKSALPDTIDLLIFSNVLNELPAATPELQAEIVVSLSRRLAYDGSILIVEPAEEVNSTRLRLLTAVLREHAFTIYSPCSFIWGTTCDPSRCWSFVTKNNIKPTRLMEALAAGKEPYRYVNTDIKYSYVILRKDGKKKEPYRVPKGARVLRFSQLHRHVGKRINVACVKMSEDLGDSKTHIFKFCDGTAQKPVYGVLPAYHLTRTNEYLLSMPYGSLLELRNVLVRYNKEHDAYNLLINRNSDVTLSNKTQLLHNN